MRGVVRSNRCAGTASVFTAGVQPDNIIPTRSGGNVNLQEETSDTTTLGVVFSPTFLDNLVVTLDYFDIKLDGAIAQLGGGAQNTLNLCYLTVQDVSSDFCQAVHRNPASGSITVPYSLDVLQANIGRLATIGYDLGARYGWDAGFGMEGGSRFDITHAVDLYRQVHDHAHAGRAGEQEPLCGRVWLDLR